MNVFPIEPKFEIGKVGFGPDANGHSHDLLNRSEFGQRLTDLVDRTEQPLVIALDGPWGSGKSHFLKLWAGAHKLEMKGPEGKEHGQAEVIYFDAFEHDFLDDPLVSLVAKLAKDAPERGLAANAMNKVKTAAAPLLKLGARIGLAVATAVVSEVVGAVGDAAIGAIGKTAEEKIDEFWKIETTRIAAMSEFRAALEALTIKEDGTTQKIVFIIDELDRCRPDYALQMLEIIKHFFTVPNVHFVLGANLSELENSVKARYGADINARKYLQKFVMLEMRLPETSNETSRLNALEYFQIRAPYFIKSPSNYGVLLAALEQYSKKRSLTIRDTQRILTIVSLGEPAIKNTTEGYRKIWLDASMLKVLQPSIYQRIRLGSVTFGDLSAVLNFKVKTDTVGNARRNVELNFDQTDDLSPKDETQFHSILIWAGALEQKDDVIRQYGFSAHDFAFLGEGFGANQKFTWEHAKHLFQSGFDTFTLPTP